MCCGYRRTSTFTGWVEGESKEDSEETAREIREKQVGTCIIRVIQQEGEINQ